jgi:hypothetical protein
MTAPAAAAVGGRARLPSSGGRGRRGSSTGPGRVRRVGASAGRGRLVASAHRVGGRAESSPGGTAPPPHSRPQACSGSAPAGFPHPQIPQEPVGELPGGRRGRSPSPKSPKLGRRCAHAGPCVVRVSDYDESRSATTASPWRFACRRCSAPTAAPERAMSSPAWTPAHVHGFRLSVPGRMLRPYLEGAGVQGMDGTSGRRLPSRDDCWDQALAMMARHLLAPPAPDPPVQEPSDGGRTPDHPAAGDTS